MSQTIVFVGSYATAEESGVEVFNFNSDNGQLTKLTDYIGLTNPTFLNVDQHKKLVYTCSEMKNEDGSKSGEVAVLSYDETTFQLELKQKLKSTETTTCHIQRDHDNQFLSVTSYHGGSVGLLELNGEGLIEGVTDISIHEGIKDNPEPQNKPRAHSSFYSPNGQYLFVQDLGFDQIVTYRVDKQAKKLIKLFETDVKAGSGPRHLAFHPLKPFVYVINELNSTVITFAFNEESGKLTELQTVSTLPEAYTGSNGTAEITISKDGQYVYGSNRGHDSIVVYAVQENGTLKTIQHISTNGGHPRHFTLMPCGNYLLVANRDDNNIVTFKIDRATGLLNETGYEAFSTKPVCLVPLQLI